MVSGAVVEHLRGSGLRIMHRDAKVSVGDTVLQVTVLFKLPLVEGSILDEEAKTTKLQNKRKVHHRPVPTN